LIFFNIQIYFNRGKSLEAAARQAHRPESIEEQSFRYVRASALPMPPGCIYRIT